MIRRLVILIIAGIGAWWLMRRLASQVAVAESAHRHAVPRFEGAMVRDRICQTFLPKSRALTVRQGDEEHFFCSDACRSAFLARRRGAR
jgi:ABC-type nickel/cobalt efflux system permease component RcnA